MFRLEWSCAIAVLKERVFDEDDLRVWPEAKIAHARQATNAEPQGPKLLVRTALAPPKFGVAPSCRKR